MPKFLSNVDLSGSQLLNALAQNLAAAPTPTMGRLFYNTVTNKLGCGNGTSFDYLGGIAVTNLDDVPDSATRLAFLVAERSKLSGISTGATANSLDSFLLARGNHTGTQTAATIADFATAADLRVVAGITGKANIASPTFTGTVGGITKSMVGLSNVDNTTDVAKPVSTAQAAAIALKADSASPAFTGTPTGLTKAHVGLSNVDNTSDASKPVSTAAATANTADRDRVNHTGTQLAATISDFSTAADARIQLIVNAAPAALDTLNELAIALGNDPNFAATMTTQLNTLTTAVNLRALDSAVCHKFNTLVGTGAATTIVITHNLNTLYVTTSVCQVTDSAFVECDVIATSSSQVTLLFTVAPALNALRVAVQG